MKDLFSSQATNYQRFRPGYPDFLVEYLCSLLQQTDQVWDCGTGNGQLAGMLAERFERVYATDISENQLQQAIQKENIVYSIQAAEKTNFESDQFNAITVAQAIHWFQFDTFYKEVTRTIKNEGILLVTGYGTLTINKNIDYLLHEFHEETLKDYWEPERRYVDDHYQSIPFPFKEIQAPNFKNIFNWTLKDLEGYINTWSAVTKFKQQQGYNPVPKLLESIQAYWGNYPERKVEFPLLLRVGRILK